MAEVIDVLSNRVDVSAAHEQLASRLRFDLIAALLGTLFVGGLFVDGWAHFHGKVDQSFFTPWHAALYGSFALMALFITLTAVRNRRRGQSWRAATPAGYDLALLGVIIFVGGGGADLLWHELFGIEADTEALISPSHLLLALGMALLVTGPIRAAWQRPFSVTTRTWATHLPVVLSTAAFLSMLTFFTSYAHPMLHPAAALSGMRAHNVNPAVSQTLGIAAILLQTGILMGLLLLVLRRWRWTLPFGSLAAVLTLNAVAMSVLHDEYRLIPAALVAGLAADALVYILKPAAARVIAVRLFAFATPVIYYLAYFSTLQITEGIWWSIHMWLGAVILAGMMGWFLSLVAVPPAEPIA